MKTIKIYRIKVRPKGDVEEKDIRYVNLYAYTKKEAMERFELASKENLLINLVILEEPEIYKTRMKQEERIRCYNLETKLLYDFKGDRKAFNEWRFQ